MESDSVSKIYPEKVPLEIDQGILESEKIKWGLPLKEVYKHGLLFYKDKEGKALHLSYEDRLKLVAYTQQTVHGPLDITSAPPLGVLDVIGRDRRAAWQALGQMSQIQAMAGFIHSLDRLSPLFKTYIEAIHKDFEEKKLQETKKENEEKEHIELQNRIMQDKVDCNEFTEEQQVQRIKDALNAQSYDQFLEYAQQQYPGNFDQQAVLIRQLQDQHYHRYIQQLAVDQRMANLNISPENNQGEDFNTNNNNLLNENVKDACNISPLDEGCSVENKSLQTTEQSELTEYSTADETREEESDGDIFPVEQARMWIHGNIIQFKESAEASGGKLTVGHGETVTVRVPTHADSRALCWEFATDGYDIGFGLYFEWSKSPTSEVTIHVSESDDEEDGDDDGYGDEDFGTIHDPEAGPHNLENTSLTGLKAPTSIVIPIFRRDCFTQVYGGSHNYPGEGVYLLKFDNTYSLWRSKTLYYKVYTQ